MKILDKYLLKTFLSTFFTVFVILFFIFILQSVWLFIAELAGKDLDLVMVLKFLLFAMPRIIPLVLPLSVLLSSIMTFGNLAENYEFAAMKSAGISLQRAMKSLIIFISILSIVAFSFANNVIPYAEYKFINFRRNIAQLKPALAIAEGQFSDVGLYSIKVNKKSGANGNTLTGITVHKKSALGDGNKTVIKSKDGLLISSEKSNTLQMVLNNGYYYEDIVPKKYEDRSKMPFAKSSFKQYVINIDLSKLNKVDVNNASITNTNTMLNVSELNYTLDSLRKNRNTDILSFSENINQRIGIQKIQKVVEPFQKHKLLPNDVLSLYTNEKKLAILGFASSTIENTLLSITGTNSELENKQKNINSHILAFYDKFVIAFACFLMFFIGAPLGAIIRKGGLGLPIVFAILIFISFHFINTFGKKIAQENGLPPFLGAWMSSFILSPLAILLTYRATNDISGVLNFEGLSVAFQKLTGKFETEKAISQSRAIIDIENYQIIEDEDWKKLNGYSNDVLIRIVKNAKQFNYSEDYRTKAIVILEKRGILQVQLQAEKNLENSDYNAAQVGVESYYSAAETTFLLYIIFIISFFIMRNNISLGFILLFVICFLLFGTALYISQTKFDEICNKMGLKVEPGIAISFLIGLPFFIFMHFYNIKLLRKALSEFRS